MTVSRLRGSPALKPIMYAFKSELTMLAASLAPRSLVRLT